MAPSYMYMTTNSRRFPTLIALFCLQCLAAYPLIMLICRRYLSVADTPLKIPMPPSLHPRRANDQECGFMGDADAYGLGIRIGIYFQWASSILAFYLLPSEAPGMRRVNNCFQAGMLGGLLFLTCTKGDNLYAVEAYLLFWFILGGIFSSTIGEKVLDVDPRRVSKLEQFQSTVSEVGGYFRILLTCGYLSYGLWMVYVGMDHMKRTGCGDYAVILWWKIDLFTGWYRTVLKVCVTGVALLFFPYLIYGTYHISRIVLWGPRAAQPWTPAPGTAAVPPRRVQRRGSTSSWSTSRHTYLPGCACHPATAAHLGVFILNITSMELTIRWNKISDVGKIGSTGQLLPLIVGGSGLVYLIMKLFGVVVDGIREEERLRLVALNTSTTRNPGSTQDPAAANGQSVTK